MFTELLTTNSQIRQITGVQNFHDAGYYGERVYAASGECWNLETYNPDGLGSNPTNSNSFTSHGLQTAACFFQVAPMAHLAMFSSSGHFNSDGSYESKIMEEIFPYIEKNNITTMFTSLSSEGNSNFRKDYNSKMLNLPNFCSCWPTGNSGEGTYGKMLEVEEVIGVGGFTLANNSTQVIGFSGSSTKDYIVDFCAPFNVHYQTKKGMDALCSGTSAATPWLCGMICLVNDFFIDKTGKPLTRERMVQFLKDYSKDIEEEGLDKRSGWGVPCLPKPSEININKYVDIEEPEEEENENSEDNSNDLEIYFPLDLADWAKDAWKKAYQKIGADGNRIMDGTRPTSNITRQEVAVILDRCGLLD